MQTLPSPNGPLSGIRVLELTTFLSGPYATMVMADLGAEVIKLEPPEGDLARHLPPHFVEGDSVYYLSVNRNKSSISLDLKTSAGQDVARRLALACDVVVENLRPGVAARLGLDYAALSAENPRLIWCSISGFGQDGPYRDLPAYDIIVQAMSGGMSLTGEEGRPPVRAGVPIADVSAGMFAVIGVLAAFAERQRTGRGQLIDISMLDAQISMLTYQAAYYLHSGNVPGRQGRGHDSVPTYRTFEASDGTLVVIAATTERMWRGVCEQLGVSHLAADPRFKSNADRLENKEVLWPLLEAAFRQRSADEWVSRLRAAEVPVAKVNSLGEALADPQVLHREMVLSVEREGGGTIRLAGDPIKRGDSRGQQHRYPPRLGENTTAILTDILKLSREELEALFSAGCGATRKA